MIKTIIQALWLILLFAPRLGLAGALEEVPQEQAYRALYAATPIALHGTVVDPLGTPLAGVVITLDSNRETTSVMSGTDGRFIFSGVGRSNGLLTFDRLGYHTEVMPTYLRRPLSMTQVDLSLVVMKIDETGVNRFLFGGDTSFGRRFLGWDPNPTNVPARTLTPPDNPDAFVQYSDPLPGAREVVKFLKPLFLSMDYPIINLESAITDNPVTPHLYKTFVYYTPPGAIPALREMGIDYVTMGNNHVYDYLDQGVTDTITNLVAAGFDFSGVGHTIEEAIKPFRADTPRLSNHPYSFISLNSVSGAQNPPVYNATEDHGGAGPLNNVNIDSTLASELAAGRTPIMLLHTGKEYTFEPTAFAREKMERAVDSGAALVIAGHTHVAEGFQFRNGVFMVHSMGNLFFDQARLETMYALTTVVDMKGSDFEAAWVHPIYVEDYRPRQVVGRSAGHFVRRLSEFSDASAWVGEHNGKGWISDSRSDFVEIKRRASLSVTIPPAGWTTVDLRGMTEGYEYTSTVTLDTPNSSLRMGRDILVGGDFEDEDVDDVDGEAARWFLSKTSGFLSTHRTYRGAGAIGSVRNSEGGSSDSVIAYRNRTRVMGDAINEPNKDLTLLGHRHGQNAGTLTIISRYYASFGDLQFPEEVAVTREEGSYDWERFEVDLNMPPDAVVNDPAEHAALSPRALRLFIRHSPPSGGSQGILTLDEFAVINWEASPGVGAAYMTDRPVPYDFIRVASTPGETVNVSLTFSHLRPRVTVPRQPLLIWLK